MIIFVQKFIETIYLIHNIYHSSRSIITTFHAQRAASQHAKKPLPVITKGPKYVQTPAVIIHNMKRRVAVSFMMFFAISLCIEIRYAQTMSVTAPDAIDKPAPSYRNVFSLNG